MEPVIDEAAVWRRVTGAAPGPDPAQSTGPLLPDLLDLLDQTRRSARESRALANRSGGETRQVLLSVSRRKQRQARTLVGLCRFLTGEKPEMVPLEDPAAARSVSTGIRGLMQREELAEGRAEAMAGRSAGEVRKALLALARENGEIFQELLKLLGAG